MSILDSLVHNPLRLKTQIWDDAGNEIWNKDGEAHSFVRNIFNIVATQALDISPGNDDTQDLYGVGSLTIVASNGTSFATSTNPYDIGHAEDNAGFRGAVANSTSGIVVGTGTSGFTFEDFQLGTPILSGSAAGQLAYSSHEPIVVGYNETSSRFSADYIRFFNNNSGGTITVSEIGLVSAIIVPTGARVMVCRDALSTTLPIPDSGQLKVTYTFTSPNFSTG